ncbi:Metallopeptidase, catalytic domain-containing protein [Cynara cardunculus var. scolymus]|uniref:Metallopeptidase, catalytic domain-containing protein n=1 Tax=Cynara cardunculus var. scolymus TaxID=59895 RepID=A0A103XCR3_CYNCS|nr:Metallopeptidase, catalytic domain-containing protein [Cynara cardunculus var. scolymus]
MASLIRRAASSLCSNSNNRHFFAPAAIRMEDTGLYGCNHLKTPKGFQRIVDEAIERSNELVGYISRMPSSAEIINAMDEISNTVCQVVDSAELCRHTHPDREFVDEAVKASMRINEYLHVRTQYCTPPFSMIIVVFMIIGIQYLNTNLTLYDAVLKADQDPTLTSEEAKRVAHDLRIDFEKGGIHLCAEKKDRVSQLNVEIAKCCAQYNENIAKEPGHVDVYPASCIPKNLHHLVKPVNRSSSAGSRVNFRDKGFRIVTEPSTVSAVLQWTSDDEVRYKYFLHQFELNRFFFPERLKARKMTYIQSNSVPHANLGVLDNLIAARHEIAQVLLVTCVVRRVLVHILRQVYVFTPQMCKTLLTNYFFASYICMQIMGYKSYAGYALHSNMASSPDVVSSFLVELSKNVQPKAVEEFKSIRDFKRGKSGQHDIELEPWDEAYFTRSMKSSAYNLDFSVVASYFSLSQCIEGLKLLVESLFGVKFLNIPLTPGESWHPDVMKMALHHPDEGDLGYIYLDLNSRRGKYPGCAHFAIRGGRRLSKTEYQLPIIALVCNFSKPHNSATVRLNHSDVDTLFHEFGHALHSLLSRTDHQHFSGTRVAFDMAETPSNLFEYYAWDYRVLKKFARHYSTGDIIPEKLVESMQGARKMFSAMELQQQIFYALADQALYGDQTYSPIDTTSIVADLREQHTNWKHVEGTHWQTRFSHLLYYGAGYYSYLYAKCFASTIWERVCKDDPLSLETGSAIRTKLLQHGGAKDPAQLLNDLAGDGIIRYQNGGIVPDITSLCNEMNLRKR